MRQPNNKALAVLGVLRESGELACDSLWRTLRERTPCGACNGTGEGDDSHYGCRRCYGRGLVPFGYSDAYVALKQLETRGLVTRRHPLDEFGDELRTWLWRAAGEAAADDPLEALYLLPASSEARS